MFTPFPSGYHILSNRCPHLLSFFATNQVMSVINIWCFLLACVNTLKRTRRTTHLFTLPIKNQILGLKKVYNLLYKYILIYENLIQILKRRYTHFFALYTIQTKHVQNLLQIVFGYAFHTRTIWSFTFSFTAANEEEQYFWEYQHIFNKFYMWQKCTIFANKHTFENYILDQFSILTSVKIWRCSKLDY